MAIDNFRCVIAEYGHQNNNTDTNNEKCFGNEKLLLSNTHKIMW